MKVVPIIVILFCALALAAIPAEAQLILPASAAADISSSVSDAKSPPAGVMKKSATAQPDTAAALPESLPGTGLLEYRVPFSVLFKYDTTWNNPEHRCYEIRKPISGGTTFLFNFLASPQYNVAAVPK